MAGATVRRFGDTAVRRPAFARFKVFFLFWTRTREIRFAIIMFAIGRIYFRECLLFQACQVKQIPAACFKITTMSALPIVTGYSRWGMVEEGWKFVCTFRIHFKAVRSSFRYDCDLTGLQTYCLSLICDDVLISSTLSTLLFYMFYWSLLSNNEDLLKIIVSMKWDYMWTKSSISGFSENCIILNNFCFIWKL